MEDRRLTTAMPFSSLSDMLIPRAVGRERASGGVTPGLYHYQRERDGEYIRYHLRVDENGPGILIAAASEALLLSPAGTAAAKEILDNRSEVSIEKSSAADEVFGEVRLAIEDLGRSKFRYPIFNLVDPATHAAPWRLSAPFQADVEATDYETLRQIIDRLWAARIPHVRFLASSRTDHRDLVRAATHAEDIGMIAGVRTQTATWASEVAVRELAEAGLDYMIVPFGVTATFHDTIYGHGDFAKIQPLVRAIRNGEVTPVADIPLMPRTERDLVSGLDTLESWGIHHVEVFTIANQPGDSPHTASARAAGALPTRNPHDFAFDAMALRQVAAWIADLADERSMQLIWLPTTDHAEGTLSESLALRGPRTGGDVSIRVTANGSVIPPRGPFLSAGNLLNDPWEEIWKDTAFAFYHGRTDAATRCENCPGLVICAADCPSDPRGWTTGDPK